VLADGGSIPPASTNKTKSSPLAGGLFVLLVEAGLNTRPERACGVSREIEQHCREPANNDFHHGMISLLLIRAVLIAHAV